MQMKNSNRRECTPAIKLQITAKAQT